MTNLIVRRVQHCCLYVSWNFDVCLEPCSPLCNTLIIRVQVLYWRQVLSS